MDWGDFILKMTAIIGPTIGATVICLTGINRYFNYLAKKDEDTIRKVVAGMLIDITKDLESIKRRFKGTVNDIFDEFG